MFIALIRPTSAWATEWKTRVGDLPISIQQIPPTVDQSRSPQLITERVVVRKNSSIDALLRARGIQPNKDAYSLVYELNPTLTAVGNIKPGHAIILPRVRNRSRNIQFAVKVDPELRLKVGNCREDLRQAMRLATGIELSRFESEDARTELESALTEISDSMSDFAVTIRDNDRLFSETILQQLDAECEYVTSFIQSKPTVITDNQRSRIVKIQKDMTIKRANLNEQRDPNEPPGRWLDAAVRVNTKENGTTISNLRVCWVPEGLFGVPGAEHPFGRVSSPIEDILPEADYFLWAARDDPRSDRQCVNRISAPLQVSVRKNGTAAKEIDLLVKVSH